MQGYRYDICTIKFWTVKFPGDIWIVEIWTVKTGLGPTFTIRVKVSYDSPVYDCPDFDCAIKTCNQGTAAPTFWSMSIVVKRLDGSRCHLVWRYVSAQTTLCYMGTRLSTPHKGHSSPLNFGWCLLWPNVCMDQNATWYAGRPHLSAGNIVLDDTYR